MTKLSLYHPVKPAKFNQFFGGNGEWYQKHGVDIIGHNGLDYKTFHGQCVYAAHDGIVTYAGVDNSEGVGVVIRTLEEHEYDNKSSYYKTIYWHLVNDIRVRVGQKIKAGTLIGFADNTGLSTGDHLHFGLKPVYSGEEDYIWFNQEQNNGYKGAIDPMPFMNGYCAEDITLLWQLIDLYQKLIPLLRAKVESQPK